MKLFLCSHFSSVGSLIKEEIDNKKVAFIPTASLREGYTGYVGSARKLFNKLGAAVTEIDISTEAYLTIQSVFEDADVIYFTGGNSFFLMDQLRKTGTDELLKKELAKGKLMIGESAGAIICAPTIQYIEQMDEKPEDYSQEDDAGLDLIDFYWHTLSIKEKGLAYCGVSLVPPSSLKAFIDVIDDIPKLYGLKGLLEKALGQNKWVIHYGL